MGSRQQYLISEIVKVCHKLDQKGFVANHDGNVSVRFENFLLATPTAESKAQINADMIITLDLAGKKVAGIGKPFSEISLHLAAYKTRPDAKAVVHAHPPYSTARGLVGACVLPQLPEAIISIGDTIPVAPFSLPGTPPSDQVVVDALQVSDVIMIAGNGVLAIGDDLEQAWLRIELLEHLCKIESYAKSMGEIKAISDSDRQKLLEKRNALGLGPQVRLKQVHAPAVPAQASFPNDQLHKLIAQEIRKILAGEQ
ncbi:MAG: class II aldolase/adducin family protein [Bdellovibrio sp.]|nr:class II aldolase/adducin family protein [Bdellovibrio sp.]